MELASNTVNEVNPNVKNKSPHFHGKYQYQAYYAYENKQCGQGKVSCPAHYTMHWVQSHIDIAKIGVKRNVKYSHQGGDIHPQKAQKKRKKALHRLTAGNWAS